MKHKKDKQNKDWLDWWLSDEAPPPEVESKLNIPYIPPPEESLPRQELPPEPVATNITVNVNVPKVSKDDLQKLKNRLQQRDITRAAGFAVGMMLLGLGAHSFVFKSPAPVSAPQAHKVLSASTSNTSTPAQTITISPSASQVLSPQAPTNTLNTSNTSTANKASFQPVAPASEPDLGQYAFIKTSYDSASGIYTYMDTVDGTTISVSEQQIPSNYSSPQDAVDKAAALINASHRISTKAGTAYVYSNPKTSAQTLVFSVKGLILSINSEIPHTDGVWQNYINSLH